MLKVYGKYISMLGSILAALSLNWALPSEAYQAKE